MGFLWESASGSRYKNIENFEEHSLTNNLALEIIIINKEFNVK